MDKEADFIIVGSGIAGLRAAIGLSNAGAQVIVLTKDRVEESNTGYAQGGVAVVLSEDDQVELHLQDTLVAGAGLCDEIAVQVLVEEGPRYIKELIDFGTRFDTQNGRLVFTQEAAHSRRRILHAQGDSTGHEIVRALAAYARQLSGIRLQSHATTLDLVLQDGRVIGVTYLDTATQQLRTLLARGVILASGGAGQIYQHTTNPRIATGDGLGMAYRAGALMRDMEFVQFHPTALNIASAPRFLLSEAMRGEGGLLRNAQGKVFMANYDPRAELAPRDIVSRAIVTEMQRTNAPVYLDMTHLPASFVRERFPHIFATCHHYGCDITLERIPVSPAAHYIMGGVFTDTLGRTSLPGLYAAGEVASTGVHGANRLASNSLLEGLVFGARAAETALAENATEPLPNNPAIAKLVTTDLAIKDTDSVLQQQIQQLMWQNVGIGRRHAPLTQTLMALNHWAQPPQSLTMQNFLAVAQMITLAALFRTESRGSHYREDYPQREDENWRHHTIDQHGSLRKQPLYCNVVSD
jgi:L-aspartate oxidase